MEILQHIWGATPEGEAIVIYTLTNSLGSQVQLSNIGAGIVSVKFADREGNIEDVALGYKDPMSYFGDGAASGKTVGRVAGRIARGYMVIDGEEYNVDCKMHGRGTDLIYYTLSAERSRFTIPSSELSLVEVVDGSGDVTVQVTLESLTGALAHFMDDLDEVKVDMPLVIREITTESKNLNEE